METYVVLENLPSSRQAAGWDGAASQAVSPETQVLVERLPSSEVSELSRDPRIAAVAPLFPTRLIAPFPSSAGRAGASSWGLRAIGADQSEFDGAGTSIAVLDTGIDASHESFRAVAISTTNFSRSPLADTNGHGTHCAGTILGRDVGGTRIGVARGCSLLFVAKVLDDDGGGQTDMIYKGIQWAVDSGADVLNLSLGLDFPGYVAGLVAQGWPVDLATSSALEAFQKNLRMMDAIMLMLRARAAQGGGAVVVAAAGNESRRKYHQDYRIGTSLPAAGLDVISVGAIEDLSGGFSVASFSNRRPTLSAPGTSILSAAPGGGLTSMSGTSMAAPHVTGAAALWLQQIRNGGLTSSADLLAAKLKAMATLSSINAPHGADDIGAGLVQCP